MRDCARSATVTHVTILHSQAPTLPYFPTIPFQQTSLVSSLSTMPPLWSPAVKLCSLGARSSHLLRQRQLVCKPRQQVLAKMKLSLLALRRSEVCLTMRSKAYRASAQHFRALWTQRSQFMYTLKSSILVAATHSAFHHLPFHAAWSHHCIAILQRQWKNVCCM
jgi:hypothetical protein